MYIPYSVRSALHFGSAEYLDVGTRDRRESRCALPSANCGNSETHCFFGVWRKKGVRELYKNHNKLKAQALKASHQLVPCLLLSLRCVAFVRTAEYGGTSPLGKILLSTEDMDLCCEP